MKNKNKNVQTYEEYRYFKADRSDHNIKDPNEPFFNRPKGDYKNDIVKKRNDITLKRVENDREQEIVRDYDAVQDLVRKLNTNTILDASIGHRGNIRAILDDRTKIILSDREYSDMGPDFFYVKINGEEFALSYNDYKKIQGILLKEVDDYQQILDDENDYD